MNAKGVYAKINIYTLFIKDILLIIPYVITLLLL